MHDPLDVRARARGGGRGASSAVTGAGERLAGAGAEQKPSGGVPGPCFAGA